jgi:1-pyrroline-4-hydroxy-2-carboxylate deaminase
MNQSDWKKVFAAITTPFADDGTVDHKFLAEHVSWLLDEGVTGIVALGSLGEAPVLTWAEKGEILRTCKAAMGDRGFLVAGVSGLSTDDARSLALSAESIGCDGLMVLPPYVYRGDWRETSRHLESVLSATKLSCMLYNNPIAYGTDITATQIRELCRTYPRLHAVKESSGDIRRITALRELLGDRVAIFVGMDDVVVEGVHAGAVGWIAGLVNALPAESVTLFELAEMDDGQKDWKELYDWFLPLLRLDTVPKFVQLIKLVQEEADHGSARVRAPRLELEGEELEEALRLIRRKLASRPDFMTQDGDENLGAELLTTIAMLRPPPPLPS